MLLLFVTPDDPVKVFHLTLSNLSSRRRRCSVTLYADWVLGENRSRTAIHVVTATEPATGAVTARNVFRQEFSTRVAFLDLSPGDARSITGDRTEFIGRNGSLGHPRPAKERVIGSQRIAPGYNERPDLEPERQRHDE